ncbi:hypothetical protein BDQ17DRAFT_1543564 [Cyathus striatus]|nr:hypothetical protein BDQ17DRAFT_1543564 [Cyathus striatus]
MARASKRSTSAAKNKLHIPRPCNKFLLYRNDRRNYLRGKFNEEHPGHTINEKVLSKIIAKEWHSLPDYVKDFWTAQAVVEDLNHKIKYPNYTFDPKEDKNGRKKATKKNPKAKTAYSTTMPKAVHPSLSNYLFTEMVVIFENSTPTALPPMQNQTFASQPVGEHQWKHHAHPVPVEESDDSQYPTPIAANDLASANNATHVPSYCPHDNVQASHHQVDCLLTIQMFFIFTALLYPIQDANPSVFTPAGVSATEPATYFNEAFSSGQWVVPVQSFSHATTGLAPPTQPESVYESSRFQFPARPHAQQSTSAWESLHPQTYERVDWDAVLPTGPGLLPTSSLNATVYVPASDNNASTAGVAVATSDSEHMYPDVGAHFIPPTTVNPQDLHSVGGYPFNWQLNNAPRDGYDVSMGQLTFDAHSFADGMQHFGSSVPVDGSSSFDESRSMSHQYGSHSSSSQPVPYDQYSSSQSWGDLSSSEYEFYSEALGLSFSG